MLLENDKLKIECCPELGGKITSFFHKGKGFELAAQPDKEIEQLPLAEESFGTYAFGMDDAFPNINAELIYWKGKTYAYPDHGEIWSAKFDVTEQAEKSIFLRWKSQNMGYCYQKRLCLENNVLNIRYYITNEGADELPCLWTWHGLMRYEEDMEVILPEDITHCRNVLSGSVLGKEGMIYPLENDVYDFGSVPKAESGNMVKFYAEGPVGCGKCGLHYPSQKITCMMEYDANVLPYFGFWITAGGFQGDYNCAMEPSNGFYDSISIAKENERLPLLAAGERMEFEIKIMLI